MVLHFFLCGGYKEWVFLVDKEPVEDQLWVSQTHTFLPDTFGKFKRSYQGYHQFHQEVIRAVLTLLWNYLSTTFVQQVVDDAVVFRVRNKRAQVHSFCNSRIGIQEGFTAEVFDNGHYLTTNWPESVWEDCLLWGSRRLSFFLLVLAFFLDKLNILNDETRALHWLLTKGSCLSCLVKTVLEAIKDFRSCHREHLLNFL